MQAVQVTYGELTNELRVYKKQGRKLATPEIRAPDEVRALGAHALATKEVTAANLDGPGDVVLHALSSTLRGSENTLHDCVALFYYTDGSKGVKPQSVTFTMSLAAPVRPSSSKDCSNSPPTTTTQSGTGSNVPSAS